MSKISSKKAILGVAEGQIMDSKTGQLIAHIEEATTSGIEVSGEKVEVKGGNGNPLLTTFSHSKTAEMTLVLPIVDFKLQSAMNGSQLRAAKIGKTFQKFTADESGSVTLRNEPVEGTVRIWERTAYDTGAEVKKEDITIAGNKVTVTALADKQLLVQYDFAFAEGTKSIEMAVSANKFPKAVSMRFKIYVKDIETDEVSEGYLVIPKATPDAGLSLNLENTTATTVELKFSLNAVEDSNGRKEYYSLAINHDFGISEDDYDEITAKPEKP